MSPEPEADEEDRLIPPLEADREMALMVSSWATIVSVPTLVSKSPVPASTKILLLLPEVSSFKDPPALSLSSPRPPRPEVEMSIPPLVDSKAIELMAA